MSKDQSPASSAGQLPSHPEIRIVLIGGRELEGLDASGKSSTGNTIFGRDAFSVGRRTGRSTKKEGEVCGRHVVVVDTPSWWWHYSENNTPKFDRFEIKRGTTLCPPGPHAFLLVIPVDSVFPDIYKIALNEQLAFLGEGFWKHTIVLFSSVGQHDENIFRKHVANWPDLHLLMKKCRNRYHILNVKDRDESQVSALLDKIDEMVAKEGHHHFPIDENALIKLEQKRQKLEKKAHVRKTEAQRQWMEFKAQMDDKLNEMTILIVGASWAARSSSGNTILGTDAFEVDTSRTTLRCVVKYGYVKGRHVTVVDTPGWYYNASIEETSEMDKLEIKRSVSLCPSGPHAVLLTVPLATAFNESYRRAVEEHMNLLGDIIWNYTIVLFTRGDWLGDTTVAERIEHEGKHLKWLLGKCGNRYHVFNNKEQSNDTQVSELFEKIDVMAAKNSCSHSETNIDVFTKLNEKMKDIEKRAKQNMMNSHVQRVALRELFKGNNITIPELRIVLLGKKKTGKSSVGNAILFGSFFEESLETEEFRSHRSKPQCVAKKRKVDRWHITVVDTPGWSMTSLQNAKEISQSVSVCPPGPHAFLLLLSAKAPFTRKDQKDVEDHMKLFGEHVWKHTILLFTHGSWLRDRPVEEYIECEGEALTWLVKKCGNRYHVMESRNWGDRAQVKTLLEKVEELVVRNRGDHFSVVKKPNQRSVLQWLGGSGTMTEEEWNKREDDLIERMLKAFDVALNTHDSSLPTPRRRRSKDEGYIPSMSGDTESEVGSLASSFRHERPNFNVLEWFSKRHPGNYASSSGHGTISTAASVADNDEVSPMDRVHSFDEEDTSDQKLLYSYFPSGNKSLVLKWGKPSRPRTHSV